MNDVDAYRNVLLDLEQELSEIGRKILQAAELARITAEDKEPADE